MLHSALREMETERGNTTHEDNKTGIIRKSELFDCFLGFRRPLHRNALTNMRCSCAAAFIATSTRITLRCLDLLHLFLSCAHGFRRGEMKPVFCICFCSNVLLRSREEFVGKVSSTESPRQSVSSSSIYHL